MMRRQLVRFANDTRLRDAPMHDLEDQPPTPEDQKMLQISPTEYISFASEGGKETTVDLTSNISYPVTYKIQTTSPEKFRVRPRCGILNPGEKVAVSILLKPEHRLQDNAKDKFLVMSMPAPQGIDLTQQQLIDMWKQKATNSPDVEQHRLCCVYKNGSELPWGRTSTSSGGGGEIDSKSTDKSTIYDLSRHAQQMEKQLKSTQTLQWITIVVLALLSMAVVYLLYINTKGNDEMGEYKSPMPEMTCSQGRRL